MADLRRATLPDNLKSYAEALSGFSLDAIKSACSTLEREPVSERQSRFPELGRMIELCRRQQQTITSDDDTYWTLVRYRQCFYFDCWLADQAAKGKRIEDLLASKPDDAPAWRLWKRQISDGTMRCPEWCDLCQGDRWIVEERNGRSAARRCAACRPAA